MDKINVSVMTTDAFAAFDICFSNISTAISNPMDYSFDENLRKCLIEILRSKKRIESPSYKKSPPNFVKKEGQVSKLHPSSPQIIKKFNNCE